MGNKSLDDKDQKLMDFLLADFNAIKNEIARRSNLQKAVSASMIAFYAWIFQYSLKTDLTLTLIVLVWIVSFLGFTFYIREGAEIKRLSGIIKMEIAKPISAILGNSPEVVIPSEAHANGPQEYGRRYLVDVLFKIFIYLIAPLYFTATYLCKACGT
jgi:hypothetical protein